MRAGGRAGRHLVYDWKQSMVNAELRVPRQPTLTGVSWAGYRDWNLSTRRRRARLIGGALTLTKRLSSATACGGAASPTDAKLPQAAHQVLGRAVAGAGTRRRQRQRRRQQWAAQRRRPPDPLHLWYGPMGRPHALCRQAGAEHDRLILLRAWCLSRMGSHAALRVAAAHVAVGGRRVPRQPERRRGAVPHDRL